MYNRFDTDGLGTFDAVQSLRRVAAEGLDLCELPPGGRLLLELGTDPVIVAAPLRDLLGFTLPWEPNSMTLGEPTAAWIRPGRYFLFCAIDQAAELAHRTSQILQPYSGICLDVSDAKVGFRLCGRDAQDCLASVIAIDLRREAFGVGSCAQTLLAQARVLIFRTPDGEGFDICVERSLAPYLWSVLVRAGKEFGLNPAGRLKT